MQPKVIFAIAAAVFSFGARANQAPVPPKLDPGKAQMALFAQTCLSNVADLKVLAEQLGTSLAKVPAEFLPLYLAKKDGGAWTLPTAAGTYVISIAGQRCAVYSSDLDAAGSEKAFEEIVATARRSGMRLTKTKDYRPPTLDGHSRQLSYDARITNERASMKLELVADATPESAIRTVVSLSVAEH